VLGYRLVVVVNQHDASAAGPAGFGELGAWLRQQREDRFWSRSEMARQLIAAAHAHGDTSLPSVDNIAHNIYRWERGVVGPGERYRLYYCKALGISLVSFGVPGQSRSPVPDGQAEAVLGFLAGVMEKWQQLTRQLGAEPPGSAGQELSDADPDQALDALRLVWGDAYGIGHGGGQWQAMRRDSTRRMLTGATPGELNAAMRADWAREVTS
jgi:hypothetical protein